MKKVIEEDVSEGLFSVTCLRKELRSLYGEDVFTALNRQQEVFLNCLCSASPSQIDTGSNIDDIFCITQKEYQRFINIAARLFEKKQLVA